MLLVAVTVLGAVCYGWLRGGRLADLGRVRLRRWWLLASALGLQALLMLLAAAGSAGSGSGTTRALLVVSQVALVGFVWANRLVPGMALVFAGFALNAAVIVANGGMPVDLGALRAVSAETAGAAPFAAGRHRVLVPGDPLAWLADRIPLPLLGTVVSIGDVVLAAGAAALVTSQMRPSAERDSGGSGAQPADRLGEPLR